ncbi:DUF4840 domain-containing protein [Prevotella melaninogenica]|uniref:DUF4840 domain-containing protein n=1 Tax=Prevotella melaninogenica TaxID=28132 RepID=A0ABX7XS10_9BACT|nr:DUF4840 domain-containing protein [Prevotella melaninogenica]QUB75882.1 DUF4840 domain-containing protein [Prevotella melaninogenica]
MKKKNLLLLAVVFIATLSLSSCLGDNDGGRKLPTPAERKAALSMIQGIYQGKLFTYNYNSANSVISKKDSVRINWEIKDDTTLVLKGIPSKILANRITDSDLKKAVEALHNQDIKCVISVFEVKPILFYVAPYRLDLGKLTYGGKTHDVAIGFWFNPSYTYGGYNSTKKITGFRLIEAGVLIDNTIDKALFKDSEIFDFRSDPRA